MTAPHEDGATSSSNILVPNRLPNPLSSSHTKPTPDSTHNPKPTPTPTPLVTTTSTEDSILIVSAPLLRCSWDPVGGSLIELQRLIDFINCFHSSTDATIIKAVLKCLTQERAKALVRTGGFTVQKLLSELTKFVGKMEVHREVTGLYIREILEFRMKQEGGGGRPDFDGVEEKVKKIHSAAMEDREEVRKLVAATGDKTFTPASTVPSTQTRRRYSIRPAVTGVPKRTAFRITKVSCSYGEEEERVKTDWDCRGVFVVLSEQDVSFKTLEKAVIEGVKEQDPKNVGILEKALKVMFWETDGGPLVTERVWEGVREMVRDLEAEIVF
ncbi:hypothetical protein BDD12DRAFT_905977 [Trichophaea hybrida]|nr:hypothetical protein BDD12DRAFT_905977 [Trichophaea hybrida]